MALSDLLRRRRPTSMAVPATVGTPVRPFDATYVAPDGTPRPTALAGRLAHGELARQLRRNLDLAVALGAPIAWRAQHFHWYSGDAAPTQSIVGVDGTLLDATERCRRMNAGDARRGWQSDYRAYPVVPAYDTDPATIPAVFAAFGMGGRYADRGQAFADALVRQLAMLPAARETTLDATAALLLRAIDGVDGLPAAVAAAALRVIDRTPVTAEESP